MNEDEAVQVVRAMAWHRGELVDWDTYRLINAARDQVSKHWRRGNEAA